MNSEEPAKAIEIWEQDPNPSVQIYQEDSSGGWKMEVHLPFAGCQTFTLPTRPQLTRDIWQLGRARLDELVFLVQDHIGNNPEDDDFACEEAYCSDCFRSWQKCFNYVCGGGA